MGKWNLNHSHSLLLLWFTCWGEIKESKISDLPRPQPGCSGRRREVGNQEAQCTSFSEQRKMIGGETEVKNARLCVYWGNTAIFNSMLRQRFMESKPLSQDLKGMRS